MIRIDGFSDRDDNLLKVPDFLFFSDEKDIDLNKVYGTKNKKYKVRGLIDLLNNYKFTIEENTPIEEEIALDPELLGKVFENLLAAYNPETKTTARKQTGSFYTPREIVNYMADESLKASLSNLCAKKLKTATEEDIKTGLDLLFTYTEEEPPFNEKEASALVEAISELKILDPACGSGAFPMGILHKLVFILRKLDPENTKWKELQKLKAIRETEKTYNIDNENERQQRLWEIEETFTSNTSDYGRKLYLIENCLYGVDIQPIAIQIAKLRFFISLIVDQKVDRTKADSNFGIRPLPNLETKFVTANTLIGIEKSENTSLFDDPEIVKLENELKQIRHKHFNARTPKTKKKYRDDDKDKRNKIAELLKVSYGNEIASQLANWDPYDCIYSASFFDSEWMFGVRDGFDIIIGNPPYGNIMDKMTKKEVIDNYQFSVPGEIASPFIEKSLMMLKDGGNLTFIITYAITFNKNLYKNRYQMSKTFEENYVYTFDRDKCKIFSNMSQSVSILKCLNKNGSPTKGFFTSKMFRSTPNIQNIDVKNANDFLSPIGMDYFQSHRLPKIGESVNLNILKTITSGNKNKDCYVWNRNDSYIWVRTSGNYWYNAFDRKPYKSTEIKKLPLLTDYKDFVILLINSSLFYFWFRIFGDGRHMNMDILKQIPIPSENEIKKYNTLLSKTRKRFMKELFLVFDKQRNRFSTSKIKNQIDLVDLLLCKNFYGLNYKETLHIMNYDKEVRGGIKLHEPLASIIDQILAITSKDNYDPKGESEDNRRVKELERQIDQMVYKLYDLTPEEIKIVEEDRRK